MCARVYLCMCVDHREDHSLLPKRTQAAQKSRVSLYLPFYALLDILPTETRCNAYVSAFVGNLPAVLEGEDFKGFTSIPYFTYKI